MRVAVATVARGREHHLRRQALAVADLDPAPDGYVVVSMDPEPAGVPGAQVLPLPVGDDEPLPLAAARNAAIEAAADADLVVMLDVDCLPEPRMLAPLRWAAEATGGEHLLAGPVGRLPPLADSMDRPTPADLAVSRRAAHAGKRPVPAPGCVEPEDRVGLFWSLSFAVSPRTHRAIGGFDGGYRGYGAEDTDYAFRARAAGVGLRWVGGAWAHHQHHPVSDPPVEHLEDIVRNATRFHRAWGRWPMEGWLAEFSRRGLVRWDPGGTTLSRSAAGTAAGRCPRCR